MKKIIKLILVVILVFSSTMSLKIDINHIYANDKNITKEYKVIEDAYIRSGSNANKNYNYENITKTHGQQYVEKNYKVVNIKNAGSNSEIISVMKYNLPTKQDIKNYEFDTYEYQFNIFKNPDFNNGNQIYQFFYTTDTNWKENTITWNNKPSSIGHEGENILFNFEVKQGVEYESKPDQEKMITIDITNIIESLVDQGIEEITIFAVARNSMNTSLMIHERTSGLSSSDQNGEKCSKIIARHEGYDLDMLNSLINECKEINSDDYTEASYQELMAKLEDAQAFVDSAPTDLREIRDVYKELLNTKNNLVFNGDIDDPLNVAYQKPTRSNLSKNDVAKVTDGNSSTYWSGKFFPAYVDIDLMDTYDIEEILLSFPENKVIYYTLYGSNDGKNYDQIYQNRSDEVKTSEPDTVSLDDCMYRIIRVYIEYTQDDAKSYLSEVKVHGTKQDINTKELRQGSFEEITGLQAYDADPQYSQPISKAETIENVYGIIDRTVGKEYRDWFSFEIAPNENNDYDYFELSDQAGKVHIKGNEGLSLATGLNYYYKNYVNVQISEQTMQVGMPDEIVMINGNVRKETPLAVRYAFNYCTLSYTFAFFGQEQWQRENDWLALNGVNVVLDLAGQEATWIKFLMNFGYSFDDAKDWLVGPGYYAWQFMDNMEVFGGPIPDDYVIDRVELARSSQRWKNSLGMQTVLQGYAGMIPTDFKDFYGEDLEVISQGSWNGFSRPSMIATDSKEYDEFAAEFYEAQEFVYGNTTDYYAVDPFHEGGIRPSDLSDDQISKEVLESMIAYDQDAIWTVQGWQSNPTDKLLQGMGENKNEHVLIVDLIKYPLTGSEAQYKDSEFEGTNWAWCLLGNFGGNPSMNGQIETMVNEIQSAKSTSKYLTGIGIISEATYDNPMLYDLIFDLAWCDESFDLDDWMKNYLERRYGGSSSNAISAWQLIKGANYNEGNRLTNELFGLRTGGVPRNLGKETISYDINDLENALRLLLTDFDKFKDSEGYLYDLSEIMRQVVSNYALYKYHDVIDARDAKDIEAFRAAKEEFLNAFDVLNEVAKTQQDQLAGEWIGKAQDLAKDYDDFSKSTFTMNAKSLITTWGSVGGALIDYGFRTYEGMFLDVRKANWVEYLNQVEQNILNDTPITTPQNAKGYAQKYWKWVIGNQDYTREADDSSENILNVANRVLEQCVFTGELDPNIGNLAIDRKVIINNDEYYKDAEILTDGETKESICIPSYSENGIVKKPEVIVDLLAEFDLNKIQILIDSTTSKYYNYEIYVSDDGDKWQKVATKNDKIISQEIGDVFEDLKATGRYIKIIGIGSGKDNEDLDTELALTEIRVYGNELLPNLTQLERLVDTANKLDTSSTTDEQLSRFESALKEAKIALEQEAAVDTINKVYWDLYDIMSEISTNKLANVLLNKETQAHNDPSGNSSRINDGNIGTYWDGGRLSATGKPYEETITPGWVIIDLDDLYVISEIKLSFASSKIWYQYELYVSTDNENWIKVGEKKTETVPNEEEDNYSFEPIRARYLKIIATNIQLESSGKRNAYHVTEIQAFGKRVSLDKTELTNAIEIANQKDESLYTVDSWELLDEHLLTANQIVASDLVSQKDIDDIVEKLNNVLENLVLRGDITKLSEAVNECEKLKEADYTPATWQGFNDKLTVAKNIVLDNSNSSQEDVDDALEALLDAKAALVKVADNKTALKIAVDLANAITDKDLEKVIPVVANEFKDARDEANSVYSDATASQVEVNNAFGRLASAMQKLEFYVGDKTALKAFIDKVSSLDSSKYTTDTWAAFETELNEAIAVYEDLNAMQEEVNNAYSELVTAFLNLRLIPDKSLLEELINQANGLNAVNYTKATFDGLTKALNEAKAVYENPNATQEEVDNAKATLEKAIAGLQTVTTDNTVKTPVNNGDTTASVKTGDDALVGTLAGLVLLSVAGYTVFRRKEN